MKQMLRCTMLLVVMLISTAAVAHSAEPGAPTQNPATVRSIQNELGRLGYYKGPMNGQADATTKAAIGRYQHDKGLPVSTVSPRAGCGPSCSRAAAHPIAASRRRGNRRVSIKTARAVAVEMPLSPGDAR